MNLILERIDQTEVLIMERMKQFEDALAELTREVHELNTLLREPSSTELTTIPDVDAQHAGFVAAATARHIAKGQHG